MTIDVENLSIAGKANYKKVMEGQKVYSEFQQMSWEPMKYNEELLMKILDDNKDTEYGKKYDFAHIQSIEDYQRKVPVSVYDDYVEYILRMTEHGEENLICSYPINHYSKSSGTMGNPKKVPMSDKAIDVFFRYNRSFMSAMLADKLGLDWIDGRCMSLTESMDQIGTLKNGATYGALSVKMMMGRRARLPLLFTSPDEATFPVTGTNTRYLHARFGLMDNNITNAGASFHSYFLEMMRYIEKHWEMLVKDIEQ